jgi:hypothetical protein
MLLEFFSIGSSLDYIYWSEMLAVCESCELSHQFIPSFS